MKTNQSLKFPPTPDLDAKLLRVGGQYMSRLQYIQAVHDRFQHLKLKGYNGNLFGSQVTVRMVMHRASALMLAATAH